MSACVSLVHYRGSQQGCRVFKVSCAMGVFEMYYLQQSHRFTACLSRQGQKLKTTKACFSHIQKWQVKKANISCGWSVCFIVKKVSPLYLGVKEPFHLALYFFNVCWTQISDLVHYSIKATSLGLGPNTQKWHLLKSDIVLPPCKSLKIQYLNDNMSK